MLLSPTPAFASGYWHGFKQFWTDFVAEQEGPLSSR